MDTTSSSPEIAGSNPQRTPLGTQLWIFIAATMLSMTGNFIQKIAVGWSVWEATHATTWLATVALADLLPTLIVSIPAGALIDRFTPRLIFCISQAGSFLICSALAVMAATGSLTVGKLVVCVALLGACDGFTWPARFAYMALLTPRDGYARAVVLFSLGGNAAFFIGPMMASILISWLGVSSAYAANAIAFLPMIVLALVARPVAAPAASARAPEGILEQFYGGFVYAARNRAILTMLLSFGAIAFTARGIMELAPSIAATALGGGIETLSLLTSAVALGALLAGLWMSRWGGLRERFTIMTSLAGCTVALVCYGASGQLAVALPGAVLLGSMLAMNNISVTAAIQLYTTPQYRGRINSLYNMIYKGGPAAGAAAFGWLAQASNIRVASAVAAAALFLLTLWIAKRGIAPEHESAQSQATA